MDDAARGRLLVCLYVTMFLNATGLGTTNFLLPVYAKTLGASYTDLGVIGTAGNVAYTLFTVLCGLLLDRFEKIRLYIWFTVAGAVTVALYAFSSTITQLTLVRVLLGVFSAMFWVSASTLVAEVSPRRHLTQSMGRYNIAWIAGFTIGPVLGGLVSNAYGFKTLFLSLAGLIIASGVIEVGWIRVRLEPHGVPGEKRIDLSSLRGLILPYATLLPFTLVLGIYMAIMPGHMSVVGLSSSTIGVLLTMTNGVRGLTFMNVERLVDWGTRKAVTLASVLLAASMYLARVAGGFTGFAAPLLLYGVGSGIMTPVILDFIAKRTSKGAIGAAMGVHEGVYGVGMSVGSFVGGMVADLYGISAMYTILVAVSLLVLPPAHRMTSKEKP